MVRKRWIGDRLRCKRRETQVPVVAAQLLPMSQKEAANARSSFLSQTIDRASAPFGPSNVLLSRKQTEMYALSLLLFSSVHDMI